MQIQITAMHREGHQGVWTPDTLWLSERPTLVEVIDADKSPKRAPGIAESGMKIGRTELAILRDPARSRGLVVSGMDQTNAIELTAQIAELNAKHAAEVATQNATIVELRAEIVRLKPMEGTAREQESTIAALRSQIAKQPAPAQKQPDQQRRV